MPGLDAGTEQGGSTVENTVGRLLGIVQQLALELHPGRMPAAQATLDSALDRDLGFDSLSRVELLLRIERGFGVSLPEQVAMTVETPRDLLRLVMTGHAARRPAAAAPVSVVAPGKAVHEPVEAGTLLDILHWHVQSHPQRPHIYLYGEHDEPETITYADLFDGARAIAAGLHAHDLQAGQSVAIMLPTGRDYLFSFFGVLLAGGIPVPIYPPVRASQLEEHLRRHASILANANTVLLITVPEAKVVARLLKAQVEVLRHVITPAELAGHGMAVTLPVISSDDIVLLQYTSGSTGAPKGVVLTHADLLANIRAMGAVVQVDPTDVFVSWLPLYHDMGLIGAWLGSLYYATPLVLMSPLTFLVHPQRWLWAIHQHRGTLSAAPNFAFELCLSKVADTDIEGLDLGSWRMAFNGAEPVSPNTIRNFSERFAGYGFRPETMAPVYGLAEAAVGLAFPPPGRMPPIDRIRRGAFESTGEALPADAADTRALEFVACGQPLPGYQLRIVDPSGRELPERHEGSLEFQGPSATSGYFRNPDATRGLFDGDWLDSGDLAYMVGGDVYITRRVKDVIIRAGRNLYPYEVEEAIGDIAGIRKGCVAVFGSADPASGTERIIVLAETRETVPEKLDALQARVVAVTTDLLGMPPDDVVMAAPHSVMKTSSGKIRRNAMRELYESGQLSQKPRAVWWQFARLMLSSLRPRLRSAWWQLADTAYAVYAHGIFWTVAPLVWLLVAILPGLRWHWAVMRRGARLLFRLGRIPLQVDGLEHLTARQSCVIVSNHASYLDGVVLVATLPLRLSFVSKAELATQFFPRIFLRRIDAEFVERFDMQRGVADARHLAGAARAGRSLMFFPEGTFMRMPGLLPFHMGAFVVAAEAGVPVVPVVIRGTRSILRDDSRFPRRGVVKIHVCEPIAPIGREWTAAVKLRDSARGVMLELLGEPDLEQKIPPL